MREHPSQSTDHRQHLRHMQAAARLAIRGHGHVEPNPMVGCIIVDPNGQVVGRGWHRTFGKAHAEINALADAGGAARGATCYVTLEPCDHHGKTGPCTQALIDAGIARVIIGRSDPNPQAAGGAQRLREAGIDVIIDEDLLPGIAPSDPFAHRIRTGLPWVTAKWAQTLDGRIATRAGESQWISSQRSRRCVHRERGRVDAILTGIGTVLADDPMLTARDVRVRRRPRRVIFDPKLQTPIASKLAQTAHDVPTTICCIETMLSDPKVDALREHAVDLIGADDLEALLRALVDRYDVTTVLTESGGGLLGRLFAVGLVNEAWVFIAPLLFGDEQATPAVRGLTTSALTDGVHMQLVDQRQRGGDIMLRYRV